MHTPYTHERKEGSDSFKTTVLQNWGAIGHSQAVKGTEIAG